MGYIESFNVQGLAGRDAPVARELDRYVNVFWGLNGSGKTSLLKILNSAMLVDESALSHVAFETAEVQIRSSSGMLVKRSFDNSDASQGPSEGAEPDEGTTLEPVGEGLWQEVAKKSTSAWRTEILEFSHRRPQKYYDALRFKHTYLPISRVSTSHSSANPFYGSEGPGSRYRKAFNDAHLAELFATQVRDKWQDYYSDSLSAIRKVQQQGLATILAVLFGGAREHAPQLEPTDTGSNAYQLVTRFLDEQGISLRVDEFDFERRYDDAPELRQVVANINEVSQQVEKILGPQREFQRIIDDLYSGGKHIDFEETSSATFRRRRTPLQVKIGEKEIPLQSISSGEKQLLQLMLETLAAEDATVMIDEPELSMHVDWQQTLIASMRKVNPHCQLLLATHSPEIMADIDEEFVFQL